MEMDLSLGLEGTHVLVTGGAGYIGTAVVAAFLAAGDIVSAFDINETKMKLQHERRHWQDADITSEASTESAFETAYARNGMISPCIACARLDQSYLPQHSSLCHIALS